MKKYFVFSDVHGCYNELIRDLNKSGFEINNDSHIIISCGDNFDRGNQNYEMFCFLRDLPNDRKILIKGNHEYLLESVVDRKEFTRIDILNGTAKSYNELADALNDDNITELMNLIKTMVNFYEINNLVFTHGFIPLNYHHASLDEWYKAVWVKSYLLLNELPNIDKTIVVGHCGVRFYHDSTNIYIQEKTQNNCGLIAIDCTTMLNQKVNILVVNENGEILNKKENNQILPIA